MTKKSVQRRVVSESLFEFVLPARRESVASVKAKVLCDLPYVTLDDDRVLAEEHDEKLAQQKDEAKKRRSGREFRWGAAVARRTIEERELELRDLESESNKARARRLRQFQDDWLFSARCGELDALLAAEVERQELVNQQISDLERVGAHRRAEVAKRREDAIFSEKLGELDALISELEAEACYLMGQRDALYCSEEAVEVDHDTKRGDYLAESLAYEEAKRLKQEVARLRHAHRKRGYYGNNDQGWFVACGPSPSTDDDQVPLGTRNKFSVLEPQSTQGDDDEVEEPKKKKDKSWRKVRRAPRKADDFDELLAEAAKWDAEHEKHGVPIKPSLVAYQALAKRRVNFFGKRVEETRKPLLAVLEEVVLEGSSNEANNPSEKVTREEKFRRAFGNQGEILYENGEWYLRRCNHVFGTSVQNGDVQWFLLKIRTGMATKKEVPAPHFQSYYEHGVMVWYKNKSERCGLVEITGREAATLKGKSGTNLYGGTLLGVIHDIDYDYYGAVVHTSDPVDEIQYHVDHYDDWVDIDRSFGEEKGNIAYTLCSTAALTFMCLISSALSCDVVSEAYGTYLVNEIQQLDWPTGERMCTVPPCIGCLDLECGSGYDLATWQYICKQADSCIENEALVMLFRSNYSVDLDCVYDVPRSRMKRDASGEDGVLSSLSEKIGFDASAARDKAIKFKDKVVEHSKNSIVIIVVISVLGLSLTMLGVNPVVSMIFIFLSFYISSVQGVNIAKDRTNCRVEYNRADLALRARCTTNTRLFSGVLYCNKTGVSGCGWYRTYSTFGSDMKARALTCVSDGQMSFWVEQTPTQKFVRSYCAANPIDVVGIAKKVVQYYFSYLEEPTEAHLKRISDEFSTIMTNLVGTKYYELLYKICVGVICLVALLLLPFPLGVVVAMLLVGVYLTEAVSLCQTSMVMTQSGLQYHVGGQEKTVTRGKVKISRGFCLRWHEKETVEVDDVQSEIYTQHKIDVLDQTPNFHTTDIVRIVATPKIDHLCSYRCKKSWLDTFDREEKLISGGAYIYKCYKWTRERERYWGSSWGDSYENYDGWTCNMCPGAAYSFKKSCIYWKREDECIFQSKVVESLTMKVRYTKNDVEEDRTFTVTRDAPFTLGGITFHMLNHKHIRYDVINCQGKKYLVNDRSTIPQDVIQYNEKSEITESYLFSRCSTHYVCKTYSNSCNDKNGAKCTWKSLTHAMPPRSLSETTMLVHPEAKQTWGYFELLVSGKVTETTVCDTFRVHPTARVDFTTSSSGFVEFIFDAHKLPCIPQLDVIESDECDVTILRPTLTDNETEVSMGVTCKRVEVANFSVDGQQVFATVRYVKFANYDILENAAIEFWASGGNTGSLGNAINDWFRHTFNFKWPDWRGIGVKILIVLIIYMVSPPLAIFVVIFYFLINGAFAASGHCYGYVANPNGRTLMNKWLYDNGVSYNTHGFFFEDVPNSVCDAHQGQIVKEKCDRILHELESLKWYSNSPINDRVNDVTCRHEFCKHGLGANLSFEEYIGLIDTCSKKSIDRVWYPRECTRNVINEVTTNESANINCPAEGLVLDGRSVVAPFSVSSGNQRTLSFCIKMVLLYMSLSVLFINLEMPDVNSFASLCHSPVFEFLADVICILVNPLNLMALLLVKRLHLNFCSSCLVVTFASMTEGTLVALCVAFIRIGAMVYSKSVHFPFVASNIEYWTKYDDRGSLFTSPTSKILTSTCDSGCQTEGNMVVQSCDIILERYNGIWIRRELHSEDIEPLAREDCPVDPFKLDCGIKVSVTKTSDDVDGDSEEHRRYMRNVVDFESNSRSDLNKATPQVTSAMQMCLDSDVRCMLRMFEPFINNNTVSHLALEYSNCEIIQSWFGRLESPGGKEWENQVAIMQLTSFSKRGFCFAYGGGIYTAMHVTHGDAIFHPGYKSLPCTFTSEEEDICVYGDPLELEQPVTGDLYYVVNPKLGVYIVLSLQREQWGNKYYRRIVSGDAEVHEYVNDRGVLYGREDSDYPVTQSLYAAESCNMHGWSGLPICRISDGKPVGIYTGTETIGESIWIKNVSPTKIPVRPFDRIIENILDTPTTEFTLDAPTGAGKTTRFVLQLAEQSILKNKPMHILVANPLLTITHAYEFVKHTLLAKSSMKDKISINLQTSSNTKHETKKVASITYMTYGCVLNQMKNNKNLPYDMLLLDECHTDQPHVVAVLTAKNLPRHVFMTATPLFGGVAPSYRDNIEVTKLKYKSAAAEDFVELYTGIFVRRRVFEILCKPGSIIFCGSISETGKVRDRMLKYDPDVQVVTVSSKTPLRDVDSVRDDCVWVTTDALMSGVTIPHAVRGIAQGKQFRQTFSVVEQRSELMSRKATLSEDVQMAGRIARVKNSLGVWYKLEDYYHEPGWSPHLLLSALTALNARNIQYDPKYYECVKDLVVGIADDDEIWVQADRNSIDGVSFKKFLENGTIPYHFDAKLPGKEKGTHEEWFELSKKYRELSRFDENCLECRDKKRQLQRDHEEHAIGTVGLAVAAAGTTAGCLLAYMCSHQQVLVNDIWWPQREKNFNGLLSGVTHDFVLGYTRDVLKKYEGFYDPHYKATFKAWKPDRSNDEPFVRHNLMIKIPTSVNYQMYHIEYKNYHKMARNYQLDDYVDWWNIDNPTFLDYDHERKLMPDKLEGFEPRRWMMDRLRRKEPSLIKGFIQQLVMLFGDNVVTRSIRDNLVPYEYESDRTQRHAIFTHVPFYHWFCIQMGTVPTLLMTWLKTYGVAFLPAVMAPLGNEIAGSVGSFILAIAATYTTFYTVGMKMSYDVLAGVICANGFVTWLLNKFGNASLKKNLLIDTQAGLRDRFTKPFLISAITMSSVVAYQNGHVGLPAVLTNLAEEASKRIGIAPVSPTQSLVSSLVEADLVSFIYRCLRFIDEKEVNSDWVAMCIDVGITAVNLPYSHVCAAVVLAFLFYLSKKNDIVKTVLIKAQLLKDRKASTEDAKASDKYLLGEDIDKTVVLDAVCFLSYCVNPLNMLKAMSGFTVSYIHNKVTRGELEMKDLVLKSLRDAPLGIVYMAKQFYCQILDIANLISRYFVDRDDRHASPNDVLLGLYEMAMQKCSGIPDWFKETGSKVKKIICDMVPGDNVVFARIRIIFKKLFFKPLLRLAKCFWSIAQKVTTACVLLSLPVVGASEVLCCILQKTFYFLSSVNKKFVDFLYGFTMSHWEYNISMFASNEQIRTCMERSKEYPHWKLERLLAGLAEPEPKRRRSSTPNSTVEGQLDLLTRLGEVDLEVLAMSNNLECSGTGCIDDSFKQMSPERLEEQNQLYADALDPLSLDDLDYDTPMVKKVQHCEQFSVIKTLFDMIIKPPSEDTNLVQNIYVNKPIEWLQNVVEVADVTQKTKRESNVPYYSAYLSGMNPHPVDPLEEKTLKVTEDTIWPDLFNADVIGNTQIAFEKVKNVLSVNVKQKRSGREALPESASQVTARGFYVLSNLDKNDNFFRDWDLKTMSSRIKDKNVTVLDATPGVGGSVNYCLQSMKGGSLHIYQRDIDPWPLREDMITQNINVKVVRSNEFCYRSAEFDLVICDSVGDIRSIVSRNDKEFVLQCHNVVRQGGNFWISCGLLDILNWPQELNCYEYAKFHISPTPNADKFYFWVQLGGKTIVRRIYVNRFYGILSDLVRIHLLKLKYAVKKEKRPMQLYHPVIQKNKAGAIPMVNYTQNVDQDRYEDMFEMKDVSYRIRHRLDRLSSMRRQTRLMKSFGRLQNFKFLTSVDFKRGERLLSGKLRNQLIIATWDQERVKVTSDRVLVSNVLSDMLHDVFAVNWANTPITQVSKDLHKVDMAIVDRLDIRNKVLLDSQVEKLLEASEFILQPPDQLFKLCTWEELGTFINRQGAAGMLDDVSKMGELYDDPRTRQLCEQTIDCLANGQDCPLYYSTCHHKVESKVSKRAVDGKIVDTLPSLLKPVPRLIQYLSSYARLVDIWIFGSMMRHHMKIRKLYKYSNTGTPITHVGDDMHAAWERHGGDDECIGVTGDASRWDHNLGPSHMYVEKECVKKFFEPSMHKIIETRYEHTCFPITFTDMGYAVTTAGQRQSGDYLTSWGNGLIHSLIQHVCWSKVLYRSVRESHEDLVEHRVDGDDNWHMINFKHICVGHEREKFDDKAKFWEKVKKPGKLFDKEPALSADISFDNILMKVAKHYEEFGVKLRSGTYTGFRLHYRFDTVDFLSHTYTEIPIKCVRDGSYGEVRKYLPVRPYSEMFGKLLFTLKQGTSKYYGAAIYDHSRGREISKDAREAIDIQTSKCMSYLFQYPHVMCIREFCLGVLSYLGGPPSDVKKWGSQFRITERLALDKVLAKFDEVKRLDWTCIEPALRQILDLEITSISDIGTVKFEQDNFWKEQHAENVALCAREYKIEAPRFVHSSDYMKSTRVRERIAKTVLHQYRMCMAKKGVTMQEQIAINPVVVPFWGYLAMSPRLISVAKMKVKKLLSEYGMELEPEILDRLAEGVEPTKQIESNEKMKSFIEQTGLFSVTSVAALRQAGKYTVKTGDHMVTFSNVFNEAFGSGFQILSLRKIFNIPVNCAAETIEDLQFTKRALETQPIVRVADEFEFENMYEGVRPRPDKDIIFEIETVKNILFKRYGLSRCETVFILNQLEPRVLQHNRGRVLLRSDVGSEDNFYRFKLCYIDCTAIKTKRAGIFMRSVVEREDFTTLVERVGTLPVGSNCVVKIDKTFLYTSTLDLDSLSRLFSVQEVFRSPFTGGSSELYIYLGGFGLQREVKVSRIANVGVAQSVPLREQVAIFLELLLKSNHLNMNQKLASAAYSGASAFSDDRVGILTRENAMIPFCAKKKFDLRVKQYEPGMRYGAQGPQAIWQYFVHPSLVHWFYNSYEREMDDKRRDVKVMSSVPRTLLPPAFKLGKSVLEFETDFGREKFVLNSDTNWLRDYVVMKTEDSTLDPKHARFRNPVKKWVKLDVDERAKSSSNNQFSYQACVRICQIIRDFRSKHIVCEVDSDDDGRFAYVFNQFQCGRIHVDRDKPLLQALRKVGEKLSFSDTQEPANLYVTRNLDRWRDSKYVIYVGSKSKLDEVRRKVHHVYSKYIASPILSEQILLVSFRDVHIVEKTGLPPMRSNRIEPLHINYSVKRCVSYDHSQIDTSKRTLHTHMCINCQTEYASFHDVAKQNHGKLCYMCALQAYVQKEKEFKSQLNLDQHDNPVTDHFFDVIAGAAREYFDEFCRRALIMPIYETWVWRFTYSRAFASPLIKKILSPLLGFVFLMLMTGCGRIGFGLMLVTMWLLVQYVPIIYQVSYAEVIMGVTGYRLPAETTYLLAFLFGLSFMTYSLFDLVKLVLHPFYYLWPSNWVDILFIVILTPGIRRTDRYLWNLCTLPIRISFDSLYYLEKTLLTYVVSFERGRQWVTELSLHYPRFREFSRDCFGPAAQEMYGIRNYYNNLTRDFEGVNTFSFYILYYFLNHDQVIVKLYVAVFLVLYAHFTGRLNKYVQIFRLYVIYSTHWLNLWQDPSQIIFGSLKTNMLLQLFGMGSDTLGGISVNPIPSFSASTDLKLAACLILVLLVVTLVDFYVNFYQVLAGTSALGPFCYYIEALPGFFNYHYYRAVEYVKFLCYALVGCIHLTLRIIFRNQFAEMFYDRIISNISTQYRRNLSQLLYPYVAILGNILFQFGIIGPIGLVNLQVILFISHWAGVGILSDDADPTIHWSITIIMFLFKTVGFSPYVTLFLNLVVFGPVVHFFGFHSIRYLSLRNVAAAVFSLFKNTFIHNVLLISLICNLTGTIHPVVTVGLFILLKHLTEMYSFLLPSRRAVANLFVLDSFLFVLMYNTWAFFDLQPTFVLEYVWRLLFQFLIGPPSDS